MAILTIINEPSGAGGTQLSPIGSYAGPNKREYPNGTIVTLTPIALISGAYFDEWGGALSGWNIPETLVMDADKTVTSTWVIPAEDTVQLTVSVLGPGSVDYSSAVFNRGTTIILTAFPESGKQLIGWSGDISGSTPVPGMPNLLSVVMDVDRHITASFGDIVVEVPFIGEIDYVRILVGSLEQPIPAAGIKVGDRFSLRVRVKNIGTTSFRPYLYYRYTKPDGSVLGSTEAKFTEIDPAKYHTFSEPGFGIHVDQPGNWYVYCELRDDYNGNVLDSFAQTLLFTAGGVIPYTDLANVDIIIASKTYRIGESVPFRFAYDYRGSEQFGFLEIGIGGSDYTFPEISTALVLSTEC